MLIQNSPPLNLTYCLNIHTAESRPDIIRSIQKISIPVKKALAPDADFGLGLRLGYEAAVTLGYQKDREDFAAFLKDNGLYVFSINGFPYGQFHGTQVKKDVYFPDWRSEKRRDYTIMLADILAALLPPDTAGSISTVPCAFKPSIKTEDEIELMIHMLADTVIYLSWLYDKTGKMVHLGLEPEPGCFLESTDDVIKFMKERLWPTGSEFIASETGMSRIDAECLLRAHLGVCLDTCHAAVLFEDPVEALAHYEKAGILVSKIQLSAGLETTVSETGLDALAPFVEPVYLHQTTVREGEKLHSWIDLPDALKDLRAHPQGSDLRVHFHVPLSWDGDKALKSTRTTLTPDFFKHIQRGITEHIEIETYSFHVLPEDFQKRDIVENIISEYKWALDKIS